MNNALKISTFFFLLAIATVFAALTGFVSMDDYILGLVGFSGTWFTVNLAVYLRRDARRMQKEVNKI